MGQWCVNYQMYLSFGGLQPRSNLTGFDASKACKVFEKVEETAAGVVNSWLAGRLHMKILLRRSDTVT